VTKETAAESPQHEERVAYFFRLLFWADNHVILTHIHKLIAMPGKSH
jgi:hypothetical protein